MLNVNVVTPLCDAFLMSWIEYTSGATCVTHGRAMK